MLVTMLYHSVNHMQLSAICELHSNDLACWLMESTATTAASEIKVPVPHNHANGRVAGGSPTLALNFFSAGGGVAFKNGEAQLLPPALPPPAQPGSSGGSSSISSGSSNTIFGLPLPSGSIASVVGSIGGCDDSSIGGCDDSSIGGCDDGSIGGCDDSVCRSGGGNAGGSGGGSDGGSGGGNDGGSSVERREQMGGEQMSKIENAPSAQAAACLRHIGRVDPELAYLAKLAKLGMVVAPPTHTHT
jgi:hypothetical protein